MINPLQRLFKSWKMMSVYLLLMTCLLGQSVFAMTHLAQVSWMSKVNKKIHTLIDLYGAQHVLVAYDIDNTLLSPPVGYNLADTQWWNWQMQLLKTNPNSKYLVANNLAAMLTVQNNILSLTDMQLIEPNDATDITDYQKQGVTQIALTAREYQMYSPTRNELLKQGINFQLADLGYTKENKGVGLAGTFMVPTLTRPIKYTDGIAMTAGQSKGLVLQYLLHHYSCTNDSCRYRAIVFVDDSKKNVTDMVNVFNKQMTSMDVYVYQYNREAKRVEAFSSKTDDSLRMRAYHRWVVLHKMVKQLFGSQL